METGVARMGKRDEDEPCRVGWRAKGGWGNVRVNQAVVSEGRGRHFCIHCLPSRTGREHRLGFPTLVYLFSAHAKASSKASSALSVLTIS